MPAALMFALAAADRRRSSGVSLSRRVISVRSTPKPGRCSALTANSWDEGLACEPNLTAAQVKSLEDDIKAHGSVMGHPPPQP